MQLTFPVIAVWQCPVLYVWSWWLSSVVGRPRYMRRRRILFSSRMGRRN